MTGRLGNRKLWRIPQKGMLKGVCAGIADYLDVPVKLVRLIVILSLFFGLFFFTIVAYIVLTFALDPMPDAEMNASAQPNTRQRLEAVDDILAASESRLRSMERYITSDTFTLRSRFRQL
ncbi:envelope stress response membrane protein PspC [Entomohabitans teleogrylli]|uniref:envelope stress response membrane protein PspC n=1 Tax=Entomohabitans teleogrylli TaxID=1384589 RepID=UPI00073D54A9|nr:envelope stress response membrane protein PspC [Entomohabitans teleogrylli]